MEMTLNHIFFSTLGKTQQQKNETRTKPLHAPGQSIHESLPFQMGKGKVLYYYVEE